jgi:hypothetical protein
MTSLLKFRKAYDDDNEFADVMEATENVYDGPSAVVAKTTRFGFTTSISDIAWAREDKLLLIAPTNKIFETVMAACPDAVTIFGHNACAGLKDKDNVVLQVGLPLPGNCPRVGPGPCPYNPDCKLHQAWYQTAWVRAMTYHKLSTLIYVYSPSRKSEISLLREMLKDVGIVVFDESHIISLWGSSSVDLNYTMNNSIPYEFKNLRKIYGDYQDLCRQIYDEQVVKDLNDTKEHCKSEAFLSSSHVNNTIISSEIFAYAHTELLKLAKARTAFNFSDEDIIFLKDVIAVMTCRQITVNLVISSSGNNYSIKGKPTENSPTIKNAIRLFLKEICPDAKVFFVSGTQFEKYPGMFNEIAGRKLANVCVPDIKHTNAKMTIIPSTWTYSALASTKSGDQLKKIKAEIIEILIKHPGEPIYIICFNIKLQEQIKKMKLELPKGSLIDYYRSSDSIGVKCDARIGIAIGIANNPVNSFDFCTESVEESRALREQSIHAATFQAWSRIKDPKGKVRSILYCIGVRSDDVDAIIRQGSDRQVFYNGKGPNNRHIPSTITLSEELPKPKVLMEPKAKQALEPNNMSAKDFIDCTVPLEERLKDELVDLRLTKSLKNPIFPLYSIIGEIKGKLTISDFKLYNPNESPDWIENNSILFYTNIISRIDKCGFQNKYLEPDGSCRYKTLKPKIPFEALLIKHFNATETVALPPFDTNDICYWCAADFDDHKGLTPQTNNVMKFNQYLRSLGIPYFVLLSGSNLSYHVWILLEPCKTFTAHKFIRQLLHDTGFDNRTDIEAYPKQKSAGNANHGTYGNHLKLPNAYNWKAGRRSMLVDPISLEPVPYITINGVLRLHEINEVPVKARKERKVISKSFEQIPAKYEPDGRISGNMRPCLVKALEQELVGGAGHQTRVAIAHEAINAGMDRESVIQLFSGQADFKYDTSAYQVDYAIAQKYKKWKCETIHKYCEQFIDCKNCLYYNIDDIKVEFESPELEELAELEEV